MPRSGIALATGFLALSVFLLVSVVFSIRQQGDDALLRHALEVEVDLGDLQGALLDAEVGQRGYLLTGKVAFLDPYRSASERLDLLLDRVGNAVRNDRDQASTFVEIRALVAQKRGELARTLALHDAGNAQEALDVVRGESGMALMDGIRSRIMLMDQAQDQLVIQRQAAMQKIGLATSITTAVSLVLMSVVALAALAEVRKRARLARFLPSEVATRLADGDRSLRTGRSGPATVAIVDIRGSTALAERLPPTALSDLLTKFRNSVSATALRHGGMIDKFMGDGALVVFGALDGDAQAPGAALAFADELLSHSQPFSSGEARFHIGIGLHHGDVFCGIVGTADRREFTVLGDTVNVAFRIEQATKMFDVDLLASEAILVSAGADLGNWREVSREPLRGRRGGIALYARRLGVTGHLTQVS